MIEIGSDPSDGTRIGPNRFGLKPFHAKVFEMCLVIFVEIGCR